MRARLGLAGAVVMLAFGCSDGSRPASPAPPGPDGDTISGRERFGWNQPAASAAELAAYRYAVYVDGIRRVLEGETCAPTAGAEGFACSAPLPPLTAGRHTIELAAFVTIDGSVLEGARSAPLQVIVAGATAPAGPVASGGPVVSSDGLPLDTSIVAHHLQDPVDVATSEDGRVLVAERAGQIRMIDAAGIETSAALGPLRDGPISALASIALSPAFADTGLFYAAVFMHDGAEPVLRTVRARVAAGTIAEVAEIASHRVDPEATAVLRAGPDGRLYLGVSAGAGGADAQTLSASTGKILRFGTDGFTPDDNPWNSPIWTVGHRESRGLAWDPVDMTLWQVEQDAAGDEINIIRRGANYGWPLVRTRDNQPGVTRPVFILPAGVEPSGIAMVVTRSSPLFGDLIVSAHGAQDLLRIRLDRNRRHQATSRLLVGRFGRIGGVAAAPDGSLLALTSNADTWGPGADLLIRVTPRSGATSRSR